MRKMAEDVWAYVQSTMEIVWDCCASNGLFKTGTRRLTLLFPQLWSLIPAEKRDEYLAEGAKKDTVPVLDLLPLGYSKVLGKGRLPNVPLLVRARWFSKEAERKITEAGGVCELIA
jgi:ribosomal protein L15